MSDSEQENNPFAESPEPWKDSQTRTRAQPRLVDFSKPLPPPDPGRPIARPHQAAPRTRPEAIVPPEDNPLRGWRWLGVRLLSRTLWPKEATTNPVMVYYTGRLRGRILEDYMGLFPWVLVTLAELYLITFWATSAADVAGIVFTFFLLVPLLAGASGLTFVSVHLRRCVRHMPLEELLLTRLKPVDIVQGLSIRPIAVQSAALFYNSVFLSLGLLYNTFFVFTVPDVQIAIYGFIAPALRWLIAGVFMENTAAHAMRCHLCLRSPIQATLRCLIDILILPILAVVGVLCLILVFRFFAWWVQSTALGGGIMGIALGQLFFFLIAALLLGAILVVLVLMLRGMGTEAMDWCHFYPREWWALQPTEEEDQFAVRRTLFSPWKPLADRKRYVFPRPSRPPRRKQ